MSFYLWSNQGIIMLLTYASRSIHIYWWLSDYYMYYIEKATSCRGKLSPRCMLSPCMTKWLCKWRRGWRYVRSNAKNAKSLIITALLTQTKVTTQWAGGGGYDQISRVTAVYTSASMFVSLHGTRWRRLFFVGKRRLQARLLLK